jgi:hypothetical protein
LSILSNALIFKFPSSIYYVGAFWIAGVVRAIFYAGRGGAVSRAKIRAVAASFFILLAGYLWLVVFVQGALVRYGAALLVSLITAFGVRLLSLYTKGEIGASSPMLNNFLGYLNAITFFIVSVAVLFVQGQFLPVDLWAVLYLVYYCIIALLSFYILQSYEGQRVVDVGNPKLAFAAVLFYAGIAEIIVIQFSWVLGLLIVDYYLQAAFLFLVYYLVIGILRQYIIFGVAGMTERVVHKYLLFFAIGLSLLLATFFLKYLT